MTTMQSAQTAPRVGLEKALGSGSAPAGGTGTKARAGTDARDMPLSDG